MADEILIDIKIPSDEVEAAIQNISGLRGKVEELRKAQKELDKSSEAYAKNAIQIKTLNKEISSNERILIANTEAQKAADGSVEQLRRQLTIVSKQWADLSQAERENTAEGRALAQQKLMLTERLKGLEKATGDNRRNVGNYAEAMKKALGSAKTFAGGIGGLNKIMNANPALMLAGFINTLIQRVGAAQPIVDGLNKVLVPMNIIFERSIGFLQDLVMKGIEPFQGGVEGAKQAVIDFGKWLFDWLIMNRIRAAQKAFEALGRIVRGDVTGGFKDLMKAVVDGALGTENAVDRMTASVNNLKGALAEATNEGLRLNKIENQIKDTQAELELSQRRLNREIEENSEILRNKNITEAERQKAARRAIELVDEYTANEKKLLDLQIEAAQLRAKQNDTDRDGQIELNRLIGQRDELEANSVKRKRTINQQLRQVQQEQIREQSQLQKEADKQALEAQKAYVKSVEDSLKESLQESLDANKDYISLLKQQYVNGQIDFEEYQTRIKELEEQTFEVRLEALRFFEEQVQNDTQLSEDEKTAILAKAAADRKAILQELADFNFAAKRKEVEEEKKAVDAQIAEQKRLEQARKQAQTQAIQGATAMARTITSITKGQLDARKQQLQQEVEAGRITQEQKEALLEREMSRHKAAQKAQALIDTYASAVSAYNSLAGIPVVGPALAATAAAAAISLGLQNVAQIDKQTTRGFADGIIGLDGAGTSTSDSIPARLSKGESVLTAKATQAFAPQLAMMERAVGNNPNIGRIGRGKFRDGVVGAGTMQARSLNQDSGIAAALREMKIYTSVTEFKEVASRLEQAEQKAVFIE